MIQKNIYKTINEAKNITSKSYTFNKPFSVSIRINIYVYYSVLV